MTFRTSLVVLGRLISYALHRSGWDGRLHEAFHERYAIANILHYPECWDTMAYPNLLAAVDEIRGPCPVCDEKKVRPAAAAIADIVRGYILTKSGTVIACRNCERPMVWLSNLKEYHCFKCGNKVRSEDVEEGTSSDAD